jgi:hypothetical protein
MAAAIVDRSGNLRTIKVMIRNAFRANRLQGDGEVSKWVFPGHRIGGRTSLSGPTPRGVGRQVLRR